MKKSETELRWGISTGTCAAAAAKASAILAAGGAFAPLLDVTLPSGEALELEVKKLDDIRCGVVKDAGDDPDATDGVLVTASVALGTDDGPITFRAGEGVGTVTLPGLKIPPGEPAINPTPRKMIERAVRDIIGMRSAVVEVSIPGGKAIAARTFNKKLGIEGGLSILGTTGRVRPMDKNALFESISLEISTHAARGRKIILLTFGSTGAASARAAWCLPDGVAVQIANEIGFALDECVKFGFDKAIVAGHPGKMLKVAAGSFDTHNRVADGRFEALCTHAALCGAPCEFIPEIYSCTTTEEAMQLMNERFGEKLARKTWDSLASRAAKRCTDRLFGDMEVAAAFTDNESNVLGTSENFSQAIKELRAQCG